MTTRSVAEATDAEALHAEATAITGLGDFGRNDYHEGLGVLLAAARASPRLPAIADRLRSVVVNTLVSRLSSQAGWAARPDVLDTDVRAPLIITGIPRSGTTLLHQLMSLDPQFQWVPRWVGEAPIVRPPRARWTDHPQFELMHERVERHFADHPQMRAAHDMAAELADECISVMVQSFVSNMFVSILPLPEYREWFFQADEVPSYRRYKDNLRLIGAETPEMPWLLKNPSHTFGMEALLEVFPDARIVALHRDPVETIASGASLTYRGASYWTKEEVGPIRLEVYARAVERMAGALQDRPDACLDVRYDALVADPIATIRHIYGHYGIDLTPEALTAMTRYLAKNPQGRHGKHSYSSGEFGIADDQVRARFADYIERHDL